MPVPLLIVGRGVAAAAAAITACQAEVDYLIVAPPRFHGDLVGETLSPSAGPILRELGVWDAFVQRDFPLAQSTFSCWGSDRLLERHTMLQRQSAGWYLDRRKFEELLWQSVNKRSDVEDHARQVIETHTGWCVKTRKNAALEAKFVIECSGRSAVVSRHFGKQVRVDRLAAVVDFLEQEDRYIEATRATLIEALPDGWWYSALLPNGLLSLAFFSDTDLILRGLDRDKNAWRGFLEQSRYTWKRVQSAGFQAGNAPRYTNASSVRASQVAGRSWVAAGDAAMAFDPLSSHGITAALWSGRKAALAAIACLSGDEQPLEAYICNMDLAWQDYRRKHGAIYSAEGRFPECPFWSRRVPSN